MRDIDEKISLQSARAIERVRHQALQARRMWWTHPPEWTRAAAAPETAFEPKDRVFRHRSHRKSLYRQRNDIYRSRTTKVYDISESSSVHLEVFSIKFHILGVKLESIKKAA